MLVKVKVKVEIFKGIGMYKDGDITSSTYDTTEGTKEELLQLFKQECFELDCKFIKFVKVGTEVRLYDFTPFGNYDILK